MGDGKKLDKDKVESDFVVRRPVPLKEFKDATARADVDAQLAAKVAEIEKAELPPAKVVVPSSVGAFNPLSMFPSVTKAPRPVQAEAINRVYAQFKAGKRFVVLEAPPGAGKSHIAVNLARVFGRTWFCTLTKQLQDQYVNEPDFQPYGVADLKGRSAYPCDRMGVGATCEEGGQRYWGTNACSPCAYKCAREKALLSNIAVCNYHSFLATIARMPGDFTTRKLIVLDEAHEIENVLADYASVVIREADLPAQHGPLPVPDGMNALTIDDYWKWLRALEQCLINRRAEGAETLDVEEIIKIEQLVQSVATAAFAKELNSYVLEVHADGKGFALRPVTVKGVAGLFFAKAEKVLLMSGTILDFDAFCRGVGIPKDKAAYVSVPCTFPAVNRPIVVGNMDMRDKAKEWVWPRVVKAVELILAKHSHQKGLLLCPSNEMLKYINRGLSAGARERLIMMYGRERMVAYQRHCDSDEPTVLAASGAWEGLDLRDDLARFAILPKLPRPALTPQVRARMDLERSWYDYRTMLKFIQGIGRSVRSESDSAATYCLDRRLREEVSDGSLLPQWVLDAVVFSKGG